jgi:hypothetical protein
MSDRIALWLTMAGRSTPAFFLLRGALWVVGTAALATAWATPVLLSPWAFALVALAFAAAALPRTWLVTGLLLAAVTGWIAATTVYGEPVGYLRLVLLAVLLYLTHVLAAMSAVVPNDAVVAPRVLVGWLPRTGVLLAVTAFVGLVGAALPELFGGTRFVLAAIAGFFVMAALIYYLARLANRL